MSAWKRNLIFHLCPYAGNDIWRLHVLHLLEWMHVFNHKRIIAIVTGEGLVPPEEVKSHFVGHRVEFMVRPNDLRVWEMATFPSLLASVQSTNAREATFYAHAKGITKAENPAVALWWQYMYAYSLKDPAHIEETLTTHPCAGVFKYLGRVTQFPLSGVDWHYTGTFFWFNNRRLFSHDGWKFMWYDRFGVESFLPRFFGCSEAHCLFLDVPGGQVRGRGLYDIEYWNSVVFPHESEHAAQQAIAGRSKATA